MWIRLRIWWDSPSGLYPPDAEIEVDGETGVRLCTDGHAVALRVTEVERAVAPAPERTVATKTKRRKRKT